MALHLLKTLTLKTDDGEFVKRTYSRVLREGRELSFYLTVRLFYESNLFV